ncbi:MAG: C39 family peptidase [Thermomicrobiales bacterium]
MTQSTHFNHRSPGSGTLLSRRNLLMSAAAVAGLAAFGAHPTLIAAQQMDPYTYITTMTPTTTVGQRVGQFAGDAEQVVADNIAWDAYIQLPVKEGQDFSYTCEFDSAWIILTAYGHDMGLDEQLRVVGHDLSIEPYAVDSGSSVTIHGGDIAEMYSGDYRENLLARARTSAVRKVFDAVELTVTATPDRASTEQALLQGQPVFFKATVDFLDWRPVTWVCPDGDQYPGVFTNDHALVAMGFNDSHVIVRDPLGPTTTNYTRPWQYRVSWERYLQVSAGQDYDAIAVGPRVILGDGTGGA